MSICNGEDLTFRRVLKPPGGEDSDIFGVRSPSTPMAASPRRVVKGQQSTIFGYGDETDRASGVSSGASTPRRKMSTSSQERLFGSEDFSTPRRAVDRMKSNVFEGQRSAPATPVAVNKKYISRNPITGDVYTVGSPSRQARAGSSGSSSGGSVSPIGDHGAVRPNGSSGPLF